MMLKSSEIFKTETEQMYLVVFESKTVRQDLIHFDRFVSVEFTIKVFFCHSFFILLVFLDLVVDCFNSFKIISLCFFLFSFLQIDLCHQVKKRIVIGYTLCSGIKQTMPQSGI